MKIFVFEYITGGGLNDQPLPDTLVREGELMLQALTKDLSTLSGVELYITRDSRLSKHFFLQFNNINLIQVTEGLDIKGIFTDLSRQCDAVWPVAPESEGILAELCEIVEASKTQLLNTAAKAVNITGNKLTTFSCLRKKKIPTVFTKKFSDYHWQETGTYVVKPIDGVGCENSFVIASKTEYEQVTSNITNPGNYIIQPYVKGKAISLSCLFKNGLAWLICCNEQQISIERQQFSLMNCLVNSANGQTQVFNQFIQAIAETIPGLWGYVGIDLIETSVGPVVLEINPRLTTSYAGIKAALGANIAENVLQLVNGEPNIKVTRNHSVSLMITE